MSADLLQRAAERRGRGEAFVMATVVWRRGPSSGKAGGKALILPDGTLEGWVGGACAEPAIVREALHALEDGTPRLMFLGSDEDLARRVCDDVVAVPISCDSQGALEISLEPVLPAPHLVAVGRSPAVEALADMARVLGWRTEVVGEDLDLGGVTERSFVVVASQGHYDERALEAALATPAAYVAVVASRKRAEALLGYLSQRGVGEQALARVRAPAGLDLGRVAHEEIGVAILAELVALRAAGTLAGGLAASAPAEEAKDPVCGMAVAVAGARYRSERDGETYYFCCAGCQARFEAVPA